MRILFTAVVLAVAGGAFMAGASSAGDRSATAGLTGTWVRTVTKADIARTSKFRHEGPGQTAPPPGVVHLTYTAHTFRIVDFTGFAIAQTYAAAAARLTIKAYVNPAKGSFCGPEIPQNASYTWSISGRILTLKAKEDLCADRDSVLQGRWTRV